MTMTDDKMSDGRKITDETLSAFLDAELAAAEMAWVRQCLSEDEQLSNRLAELASADRWVTKHYSAIDERPLPESVQALLADNGAGPSAAVIQFPLWRRFNDQLQRHAGLAAAIALTIGLGAGWLLPGDSTDVNGNWQVVARSLEATPSGTTVELTDGRQLTPRLTFINQQGDYCRQFEVVSGNRGSENIACRGDNAWQLTASVQLDAVAEPGTYRTASGGSLLDSALDAMIADNIEPETEQKIIANAWNKTPARPSSP